MIFFYALPMGSVSIRETELYVTAPPYGGWNRMGERIEDFAGENSNNLPIPHGHGTLPMRPPGFEPGLSACKAREGQGVLSFKFI